MERSVRNQCQTGWCSLGSPATEVAVPHGPIGSMPTRPMTHPHGPPNHLAPDQLRLRPGTDGVSLSIDPERADWRYLGFRALGLEAGQRVDVGGPGMETVVCVVSGGGVSVGVDAGATLELDGRQTVFDGKPWAVYLP